MRENVKVLKIYLILLIERAFHWMSDGKLIYK